MDIRFIIELSIFLFLMIWYLLDGDRRKSFFGRTLDENIVDIISLTIQGTLIPLFSYFLIYRVFEMVIPNLKNSIEINNTLGFLINFVFVDLCFYWTHRIFHGNVLWGFHLLHHSSRKMDIVVSSRNTVWTSFFFPYLWVNSFFVFALSNKTGFILSISITAMLDLWRHSPFFIEPSSRLAKYISYFFITPVHHAWHHSRSRSRVNFGANLSVWDKIFGTYYFDTKYPKDIGFDLKSDLKTKLFRPLKLQKENS